MLCVGAGGLGSPAALYLAAAGVGTIGVIDFDAVDVSNLQRQILHGTPDVGRSKLASARERLNALNPTVKVESYETALTSKNALELFKAMRHHPRRHRQLLDALPGERRLRDLWKPNASAASSGSKGRPVFATKGGPCYRCLYPEPPPPGLVPSCAEGGVLGVLPA